MTRLDLQSAQREKGFFLLLSKAQCLGEGSHTIPLCLPSQGPEQWELRDAIPTSLRMLQE